VPYHAGFLASGEVRRPQRFAEGIMRILDVLQGMLTKHGVKKTSETVLRKFPRRFIIKGFFAVNLFCTVPVQLYGFAVSLQSSMSADMTGV